MRIAGFALVMVISVALGGYFSDKEKKKVRLCRDICAFLQYLSQELSRNVVIDEIIKAYFRENTSSEIYAKNRQELLERLQIEKVCADCRELLSESVMFLSELGKGADASVEAERCRKMVYKSEKISEKIISESAKKKELYGKLGLIFGIMLCVVLI